MYSTFADAFQYPAAGLYERLAEATAWLPDGAPKAALAAFLAAVGELSQGEWEELYTRTWDLDPFTPPYIGFQIWGEDYRRGTFLAKLTRAYRDCGVAPSGELADHLVPTLRYLAVGQPLDELAQVFGPALQKMSAGLREKDASNPYLGLIEFLEKQRL